MLEPLIPSIRKQACENICTW